VLKLTQDKLESEFHYTQQNKTTITYIYLPMCRVEKTKKTHIVKNYKE